MAMTSITVLAPGQKPHETSWVVTLPLITAGHSVRGDRFFHHRTNVVSATISSIPSISVTSIMTHGARCAEEFHGAFAMALARIDLACRSGWRWQGWCSAWFFYMKRPDIPAAIKQKFSGHLHLAGQQILLRSFQRLVLCRWRTRRQPLPVEVWRREADRRFHRERFGEGGRYVFRRVAQIPDPATSITTRFR